MEVELFLVLRNHLHTSRNSERPFASKHRLSMFLHKPSTSVRFLYGAGSMAAWYGKELCGCRPRQAVIVPL
jgi:hypothetical protein